ncbi:MAG TPA: hypothetical protein PKJ62_04740 [Bacteroidia bacterium]|nr:hypothetical protein [Bacteroidia bacterium]HNS12585.1 hypothetical protein [Bacteroidia bacterium]
MKKTTQKTVLILVTLFTFFIGCKKDEDPVPQPQPPSNEEEVITTMRLTFVDSSDHSNVITASFRDPDGDGGLAYDLFDTIRLEQNKTWETSILLLNETVVPADTISNEVLDEGDEHLFCYTPSGTSAAVIITDMDSNGLPIGLQSKWYTGAAGNGTIQVELRHQPGVKDGTCIPGDTDISVVFEIEIQ